nr:hypothetical protein [Tanacetum cinerariifolium]
METKDSIFAFEFGRTTNATNSKQNKKELHGIFSTTSFTPQASFKNNLKGTRIESGFKRAFVTFFGQDVETFTGTMFLNLDQLEKQLDNKEFQEILSMAAFKVLETQFQMFMKSRIYLDDEYSIDERAQHKREYDSWVNERQIQTTEENVDTSKALDTIYDEEPMDEVQTTTEINVFATGQQHTEQPEFNNEGEVDQNAEQYHDTCPLPAKLTDNQTTELSINLLNLKIFVSKDRCLISKRFLRMEAHCVNLELKYQNQALKEGQHGQRKLKVMKPRLNMT